MKSRLLVLACFLFLLGANASADSLTPCSPNCTTAGLDAFSMFPISIPATNRTLWEGPEDAVPYGTYTFGIYATSAMTHLDLISEEGLAYAINAFDLTGPYRWAFNLAGYHWAAYENGVPGWSENANGVISYNPDPVDPIPNPEPSTWLLMITGVISFILVAKRHKYAIHPSCR